MGDNGSTPVDLRMKRKYTDVDDDKVATKKKTRHHEGEIPLDLSIKTTLQHSSPYPISSIPYYDPTNVFFNSSALLYDLFLANYTSYCQQQQYQAKIEPVKPKSIKQPTTIPFRSIKDTLTTNKQESYPCSCGERYSNVSKLVSHLKITNHNAQLSSKHDEVAKLVRGQDIWLSRDTNPANQILKCLHCSLSFETLPDLTAHMMKTNHFTPLVSSSSSSSSSNSYQYSNPKQQQQHSPTKISNSNLRSTCLVCSRQFLREVELVDHLQRLHQIRFNCTTCGMYFENENIYKEHLIKEMHHRNGKTSKNRDYFIQQCKILQKQPATENKSEQQKSRSPIVDDEVTRLTSDLLDCVASKDETVAGNALSLLQNFVIEQTPLTKLLNTKIDWNNNFDDENNKPTVINSLDKKSSLLNQTESNEDPLASLEKMLTYSTIAIQSNSPSIHDNGSKKKRFDKYRLFAEKMIRSTLS
ncbi:unnamed protein product [Rotaria magnacalcarata]|uniref:C2H2-type domain-containing protein n=3 Tax=Rotaria magnacalcarata TaxID=392030 RepID=A0A816CHZ0_9BILA|nr:unnamed protein product [Rotaria magnacalcarata]CAF1621563.1 unnamed protein product [Rotaria magnacalcarata]CAF2045515.1 unnamed protein product [Rotaria magnacalcarata]CAF3879001.1 unnamed protein product [Rotaria magnacalcarata]CAF4325987.1 unnamed protein product [Rotaria magnacalcarata]